MMQVLQYIAQHDNELNFISMLPLAGHDGSLQYRAGLHQAGVDGKVSAKTGSLQGVYNLAGFITTASGQKMAFVQYLSAMPVPPISAIAASRWYASKAACIKICTRTTNTKGRIRCGPVLNRHKVDRISVCR
jgi:D-alanyl-D-alanine carboxypeptidase